MLGGLVGAYLAIQYIPAAWQTQFGALAQGVKPGVSLQAGVACEAALAFLLNLVILYSLSGRFPEALPPCCSGHMLTWTPLNVAAS